MEPSETMDLFTPAPENAARRAYEREAERLRDLHAPSAEALNTTAALRERREAIEKRGRWGFELYTKRGFRLFPLPALLKTFEISNADLEALLKMKRGDKHTCPVSGTKRTLTRKC